MKSADELVEDLAPLLLKQQLGILDVKERVHIRNELVIILMLKGYDEAAELLERLHPPRTEEENKFIIETINKVFTCSPSKTAESTTKADLPMSGIS
jgi:hypothetical protein